MRGIERERERERFRDENYMTNSARNAKRVYMEAAL